MQKVVCGHEHSLAVDQYGNLFSWGKGDKGRLGQGQDTADIAVPKMVDGLEHVRVIEMSCGFSHNLVLGKLKGVQPTKLVVLS